MSYIPPPLTDEYPQSSIHSSLLVALLTKSASVKELSAHVNATEHDVFAALDHRHFTRIAGPGEWRWTAAGNALHMAAMRESAAPHMHAIPKRGVLPHDATADRAQTKVNI